MSGRFTRLEFDEQRRHAATHPALESEMGIPIRTAQQDLSLAVSAYRGGSFETALQMYTRALRGDRALVAAWVGQVQMLVELGEYREARLWADKALELFKSSGDLLAAKASACLRQGDPKAAYACARPALQSPGSSPLRSRARGEILLRKAADRARDCFEKSLAEPAADWFDRIAIGRIYVFHRRSAAALPYIQAGIALEPASPFAWHVLGRCQESLGWFDQARTSYEHALQLPGAAPACREALQSLQNQSLPTRLARWVGGLLRR